MSIATLSIDASLSFFPTLHRTPPCVVDQTMSLQFPIRSLYEPARRTVRISNEDSSKINFEYELVGCRISRTIYCST